METRPTWSMETGLTTLIFQKPRKTLWRWSTTPHLQIQLRCSTQIGMIIHLNRISFSSKYLVRQTDRMSQGRARLWFSPMNSSQTTFRWTMTARFHRTPPSLRSKTRKEKDPSSLPHLHPIYRTTSSNLLRVRSKTNWRILHCQRVLQISSCA